MSERRLYIWLEGDPLATPPDLTIEDVPGEPDLDLLAQAIRAGKLGRYLPTRLALSPHQRPEHPRGFRRVNVVNLLRRYGIPYRTRLELREEAPLAPDAKAHAATPRSRKGRRPSRGNSP